MHPKLLNALIRWIEIVTVALLYPDPGEKLPEDIRVDLHKAMRTLVDELRKDSNV